MNQTHQLMRTITRILLSFMLILTGFAGGFAQEDDEEQSSGQDNCSIYSVKNLFPTSDQSKTHVFGWTVKLEGEPEKNGLSHFTLVNTNSSKTCASGSEVASLIKQAWYSTDANPGPVGGPKWSTTSVVIGDGSTDNCLPNGTADRPYVIKFSVTAPFIHYALEFKSKYPVSTGVAVPKYGRNCCSTPIRFPNFCDPSPLCVDPMFTVNKTDLTCFGSANGSISVTGVTGGVSPYTYSLNGGVYSQNSTFSGLSAGTYNVKVKESEGGCFTEKDVVIGQPEAVTLSAEVDNNVSCSGGTDGEISFNSNGTVVIKDAAGNDVTSFNGSLKAGKYTVSASNPGNNGATCDAKDVEVTIEEPVAVTLTASVKKDVSCNGGADGEINASSNGTVVIKDAEGNVVTNGSLKAGTYTVSASNPGNNGATCNATSVEVTIEEPVAVTLTASVKKDVSCNGGADGEISASSNGTVVIKDAEGNIVTNGSLKAGTYTVSASNPGNNGATCNATSVEVTIEEPVAVTLTASVKKDVSCNGGADGEINASSNGTVVIKDAEGNVVTNGSLKAGTYTVSASNPGNNGATCNATSVEVTIEEPVAVTLTASVKKDVSCNGGADGEINASSNGTVVIKDAEGNDVTGSNGSLKAGNYTVSASKSGNNGATCTATSVDVTIGEPEAVTLTASVKKDVSCNGGSDGEIKFSSNGTVLIKDAEGNIVTNGSLKAGKYTVSASNPGYNGATCTATSVDVTITEPKDPVSASAETRGTECAGTKTGSITLSVSGGTAPYQYKLNDGSFTDLPGNGVIATLKAGDYTVYVKDVNGCDFTIQGKVTVAEGPICFPYYTYSQGYYGQSNGVACIRGVGGQQTAAFVGRALGVQGMTLGNMSTKYFVVPNTPTAIASLIKIMPGGGSPNILTGKATLPTVESTLLKNGKINNVLLGQTIAMWLNVNIPGNELGTLDLKGLKCKTTIVTKEPSSASSCNIPYAGTTEVSTAFPQSVVNALISRNKGTTVRDLVDMASEALGQSNKIYNGASLSDINAALDAIVNAFHGGKYFARFAGSITTGCTPLTTSKINVAPPVEEATAVKVETSNAGVQVIAYPNPYIDQVTFNVTVKNAGKGSLVIYNMVGQKVTNLFEGNMQANSTQTIRYTVPFAQRKNLVYVFRQNDTISTGKLVSGK